MFAIQCSFCQHENVSGARFCAECGSPLHLRVCPNPDCGKVSDVNASRCEHCGTVLPKIALAEPGKPGEAIFPASVPKADLPATKPAIAAWPLIIVAITAGGLPLIWFNRGYLPAPKTWQTETAKPATELLTPPIVVPPEIRQPAQPVLTEAVAKPTPTDQPPAEQTLAIAESSKKTEKKQNEKAKPSATTAEPSQPSRPCTEAVAALGLCDPQRGKQ